MSMIFFRKRGSIVNKYIKDIYIVDDNRIFKVIDNIEIHMNRVIDSRRRIYDLDVDTVSNMVDDTLYISIKRLYDLGYKIISRKEYKQYIGLIDLEYHIEEIIDKDNNVIAHREKPDYKSYRINLNYIKNINSEYDEVIGICNIKIVDNKNNIAMKFKIFNGEIIDDIDNRFNKNCLYHDIYMGIYINTGNIEYNIKEKIKEDIVEALYNDNRFKDILENNKKYQLNLLNKYKKYFGNIEILDKYMEENSYTLYKTIKEIYGLSYRSIKEILNGNIPQWREVLDIINKEDINIDEYIVPLKGTEFAYNTDNGTSYAGKYTYICKYNKGDIKEQIARLYMCNSGEYNFDIIEEGDKVLYKVYSW